MVPSQIPMYDEDSAEDQEGHTYHILKLDESTCMKRKHTGLARSWRPVDQDEGERLPTIVVAELIREYNIAW